MKVQNIKDIDAFFKTIDDCSGRVKLSQYVSMANIFSGGEIPELEIIAYEPEDTDRLIKFMMNN